MVRPILALMLALAFLSSCFGGCVGTDSFEATAFGLLLESIEAPDTIVVSDCIEAIQYDFANNYLLAVSNSSLSISKYWVVNDADAVLLDGAWKTALKIDGKSISAPSKIFARSGIFTCKYEADGLELLATTFCSENANAMIQRYDLISNDGKEHKADVAFDVSFDLGSPENAALSYAEGGSGGFVYAAVPEKAGFLAFGGKPVGHEETANKCNISFSISTKSSASFNLAVGGGWDIETEKGICAGISENWDQMALSAIERSDWIDGAFVCSDHILDSMFSACLDCGLSNYKETLDGSFKGFYAGVRYKEPARTYFRDSYWTVQSVLPFRPDLVRNQIIALAKGVHDDGTCGSGVVFDSTDWWTYHYDSPSFFVMMVYDYIAWTGDLSILDEMTRGKAFEYKPGSNYGTPAIWSEEKSVWDKMQRALDGLKNTDSDMDYLAEKPMNPQGDWADQVARIDEVTYVNALYYRALACAGEIAALINDGEKANEYSDLAANVKDAINSILWSNSKGYYVDFTTLNFLYSEDHLAEDTFVALLYGVADDEKRQSVLNTASQWFESRNNNDQPFGDWGTLCCWPLYKNTTYRNPPETGGESGSPYRYHNGADWPYLDGINAMTRLYYGDASWEYPLTKWWEHSLENNWLTPVEYYQPEYPKGGMRQAWSAMPAAAVIMGGFGFWPEIGDSIETIELKAPPFGDCELHGIIYKGQAYDILAKNGEVIIQESK